MLTSPQSLPPDGSWAFWIESPPHALSASADVVASAASTACVRVTLMFDLPSLVLRWCCVGGADGGSGRARRGSSQDRARALDGRCRTRALSAVRRDPVEHDAEQHDGDAGGETTTDVVGLPESLDH